MADQPNTGFALESGQHLGPYKIIRLAGRSSLSTVYRAEAPLFDTAVALKVLNLVPDNPAKVAEITQRFRREMAATAALQHPNIANVLDYGIDHERFYLVTQLVEGPSLRDRLSARRGGFPQDQAVALFEQVADALAYAHSKHIIHQDLRPGNILLTDEDTPVVVDFGLTRVFQNDLTTTAEFSPNTPLYMAPEEAAGQPVTPQADIYSLGILLYELMTGDVPFKGGTAAGILVQHIQQVPRPPSELKPDLDPRIDATILRALVKDPEGRFPSPRSMAEAIQAKHEETAFDTVTLSKEDTNTFRQKITAVRPEQSTDRQPDDLTPDDLLPAAWNNTQTLVIGAALLGLLLVIAVVVLMLASSGG